MKITIVDQNEAVVGAAKNAGLDAARGPIIGLSADAVVSPANSFGFMDGGVDYAYSVHFGWHVQDRVRAAISLRDFAELLVGEALVVATDNIQTPWLVCAPTMRVPRVIQDANDIRLAARAAVKAALDHGVQRLAIPGMGTGCGRLAPEVAARAMALGIAQALNGAPAPQSWREAQRRHFELLP
jgi:O-acetyl-ADP-ribose deacetylase (regulator of RNase III)